MWLDIFLQAAMLLAGIFSYLWMHGIPSRALHHYRQWRDRNKHEAKRRFVHGAQLLAQARRSSGQRSLFLSLAKSAESEADAAIKLDPTDAASHVLKAIALELQGFNASALDSICAALSPIAAKSLSDEERADALFKRADLRVRIGESSGDGALGDAAVEADLVEAVKIKNDNVRAWCLLGKCYEATARTDKAREAFEAAVKAVPDCKPALEALERLGY